MIIDLAKFIERERPGWMEFEQMLQKIQAGAGGTLSIDEVQRFQFLYQKVSSDLAEISTFASEPELKLYLESLIGRAYGEIHETRTGAQRFSLGRLLFHEFPCVFRTHLRMFWLALGLLLIGALFGGIALAVDPEAKNIIVPFSHLAGDPSERVRMEETQSADRLENVQSTFAGELMQNNIRVSILALALGISWGIGTGIVLFYNGVILGAVAMDYVLDGQTVFLLGWLLPHGVIEIPAAVIASQAGLILGRAMIGRGDRASFRSRVNAVGRDLSVLIAGVAAMLVWAGVIEAFLSQYHAPVLPYWVKITFGCAELAALIWFLGFHGKRTENSDA